MRTIKLERNIAFRQKYSKIIYYFRLKPASEETTNAGSIGFNNFIEESGDVAYTEVAPLWDSIAKPLVKKFFTVLQKFGSISPDVTSSSNTGGFINKTPLFSQVFGDGL